MKKKVLLLAASACTISLLAGCSSSPKNTYKDYLTLGEYKGLDLTMIKTEVTDDMIQDEIDYFLEDNATYTEITDRAAEENDTVNVNYTAMIDGEEYGDESAEDFDLVIGEGYLLDELEAGLVGMTAGETKEISAAFPEDYYDEAIAGKAAVFSVTLNKISVEEIPEYTDEFIASVTDYSTTAEYEEALKSELYTSTEADNRSTAGIEALSKVVELSTFEGYPQELYDTCKEEYDAMNQNSKTARRMQRAPSKAWYTKKWYAPPLRKTKSLRFLRKITSSIWKIIMKFTDTNPQKNTNQARQRKSSWIRSCQKWYRIS